MSKAVGRNDPCPCGSGLKFKRCCIGSAREDPAAPTADGIDLNLVIDTPRGPMIRRIPAATPLRRDIRQGTAAEEATHNIAASWGLPDFVFRAELAKKASGVRELGDGLVVAGRYGLSVQVKSREGEPGDEEKERRWISKKAAEGIRQADGSIRELKRRKPLLTNSRGRCLMLESEALTWLNVVVIDHPDPPDDCTPDVAGAKNPSVVLLRRDWDFLFAQLKSTTAVVRYIERVAGEPWELGYESARYYNLAQADADASPSPISAAMLADGRAVTAPLLPMAPAGTDDLQELMLLRALMEDIALTNLTSSREEDRLKLLSELDRLPVAQRALIGGRVLSYMDEVDDDSREPGLVWRFSSVRAADGRIHLGFGTCSRPYTDPSVQAGLEAWTRLRHYDVLQAAEDDLADELVTVAVVVTPRTDDHRPWDTSVAAVSGRVDFTAQELRVLREHFPGGTTSR